jgi:hypothetical protein
VIAARLPGRSAGQCQATWCKVFAPSLACYRSPAAVGAVKEDDLQAIMGEPPLRRLSDEWLFQANDSQIAECQAFLSGAQSIFQESASFMPTQ